MDTAAQVHLKVHVGSHNFGWSGEYDMLSSYKFLKRGTPKLIPGGNRGKR